MRGRSWLRESRLLPEGFFQKQSPTFRESEENCLQALRRRKQQEAGERQEAPSEQSGNSSLRSHIDALRSRDLGEVGHGHDLARQRHDKSRVCGDFEIADGDGAPFRRAQQFGIVGKAVCVLATQTGRFSYPSSAKRLACFS